MPARYNSKGGVARYMCQVTPDQKRCQSVGAAQCEALIERLVLEVLEPLAREVSAHVVADLEAARAESEGQWYQKLGMASCDVERARLDYGAADPVEARDREREWLAAVAERARLARVYEDRNCPPLNADDHADIQDLELVWRSESTTQQQRQVILRLMLRRVVVKVVVDQKLHLTCHWQGGNRTRHELADPYARFGG